MILGRPTKAQTRAHYELQAALANYHGRPLTPDESAELRRDKQAQDHRERVLGDGPAAEARLGLRGCDNEAS